jgi:MFS family permease
LISVLIRYFHLPILEAADTGGFIAGVTGLVGLTFGGYVADWFHKKNPTARLVYGAVSLLVAALATAFALMQPATSVWAFAVLFGLGWLLYYAYYNTTYPALQDVVEPRLRATAIALYFACMYILGGAAGSTVVGKLSDHLRQRAMDAAGATQPTPAFAAIGLHDAFYLIPVMFFITGGAMLLAARSFKKDAEKMRQELTAHGG